MNLLLFFIYYLLSATWLTDCEGKKYLIEKFMVETRFFPNNNSSVAFLMKIIVVGLYPMIWICANEWSPAVHYTKQYLSALLSFCLSIHLSIFGTFAYFFFYMCNYRTYIAIAYCLLPFSTKSTSSPFCTQIHI